MRLIEYIKLARPTQWYKNLVVFLPLFFVVELFNVVSLKQTIIGFFALCFISSANYALNDIIDIKRDKVHPEKRFRPLASGRITLIEAIFISVIFFVLGLLIAYNIDILFFFSGLLLAVLTFLYSIWLKNEPVLDILMIAVNFVIRAVSGAFIIHVIISPWLILCPFFLALFLAVSKRESDLMLMKGKALMHKNVLKYYDMKIITLMMNISTTCLIIVYSLYSFSKTSLMLLTIPFAVYAIFRFYLLVNSSSEIARNPEKFYKDWKLLIVILLWAMLVFSIYYFIDNALVRTFIK
jgi:4-hydroxybenzoate polyprenyltransferase